MSDSPTPLADQLAKLRAKVDAAAQAASDAQLRAKNSRADAAKAVTADLVAYKDAIDFRKPNATPESERPAKLRRLTEAVADAMREGDLVFTPVKSASGYALHPTDLSIDQGVVDTTSVLASAKLALSAFERNNREALAAERKAADAQANRDALASGDADRIKSALGIDQDASAALTSSDLTAPTRRRATAPA